MLTRIMELITKFINAFRPLSLPFPDISRNDSQNINNVVAVNFIRMWLTTYAIPVSYHNYWLTAIVYALDPAYLYYAGSWGENGVRHTTYRPEWLNTSIIAHEQAHNSYALLAQVQRDAFPETYQKALREDRLVKYLYTQRGQNMYNDVEAHAEIYRYLGGKMPNNVKAFYPKLF